MENPKVMIPATMETFRFMDLRGGGKEEWRERIEGGGGQDKKINKWSVAVSLRCPKMLGRKVKNMDPCSSGCLQTSGWLASCS